MAILGVTFDGNIAFHESNLQVALKLVSRRIIVTTTFNMCIYGETPKCLTPVLITQIFTSLLHPLRKCLFTLPNPNSGIVPISISLLHAYVETTRVGNDILLLVGLVFSFWVPDLAHEVIFLLEDKVTDTG